MAVYTEVARDRLDTFLQDFDLGQVVSFSPIAEGVENTNYVLVTTTGKFILTLFEARVRPADLPFHVGLMQHLASSGIACPVPIPDRSGHAIRTLHTRPALITTFLSGRSPQIITARHCEALGGACAALQLAAGSFDLQRSNDLSVRRWRNLFEANAHHTDSLMAGLEERIRRELDELEALWPLDLPAGIIHADLFPDNVFFVDMNVTGIMDFYFACNDFLAYDLAICVNAWCFGGRSTPDPELAAAMIRGYESRRVLEPEERNALPILARGAALRFFLTRLEDWFKSGNTAGPPPKDPLELLPVIEFHRHCHNLWSHESRSRS